VFLILVMTKKEFTVFWSVFDARRFPGIAATRVVKDLPESRSLDGVRMVGARDFLTGRGV